MNKLLKGAIAGAAGVALLLGGAGTFALWNSTETVSGGTVASGTLTIAKSGSPSWKNVSSDAAVGGVVIPAISSYKIVPGDKIELTQVVTINATGNNLKATLSYDDATVTTVTPADDALKSELLVTVDATGSANVARIGTGNTFAVTPSGSSSTVTLTVTIELPSSVAGTTAQAGTVGLTAFGFNLEQDVR